MLENPIKLAIGQTNLGCDLGDGQFVFLQQCAGGLNTQERDIFPQWDAHMLLEQPEHGATAETTGACNVISCQLFCEMLLDEIDTVDKVCRD